MTYAPWVTMLTLLLLLMSGCVGVSVNSYQELPDGTYEYTLQADHPLLKWTYHWN